MFEAPSARPPPADSAGPPEPFQEAQAPRGVGGWTDSLADDRGVIPADLEGRLPGAELAGLLAEIDRTDLNGHELVRLLRARWRLIAHLQAEFYADLLELAHTPPGHAGSSAERTVEPDEFCVEEVGAALCFTNRAAEFHTSFSFSLQRLPGVADALRAGQIDLPRARILCDETDNLDAEEAGRLVGSLLPQASAMTTGQLVRRLRRRLLDNDPEAARKRYAEGLEGRRVQAFPNPDGTADLWARQLPPQRVAAIMSRVDEMARRLSRHDSRTIDQIRADLIVDLLEGSSHDVARSHNGVEIRVDLATLAGLEERAADIPGWGPVIADIARRVAEQVGSQWRVVATRSKDGEPIAAFTARRRPTGRMKRLVAAHHTTCIFPGCATPASRCHMDHTIDWSLGGKTIRINLGPICARHHLRAKHRAGWRLSQPRLGHFVWISPRGHIYKVRPPPE